MKQLMTEPCDLGRLMPDRNSACFLQTQQIVLREACFDPGGARCCWRLNFLIQSVSRAGDLLRRPFVRPSIEDMCCKLTTEHFVPGQRIDCICPSNLKI